MIVYKYLPAKRVPVLSSLEIGFSAPSVFNDPFEMSPVLASLLKPEVVKPFVANKFENYMNDGGFDGDLEKELEKARPFIAAARPELLANNMEMLRNYLREFATPLMEELGPPT